MNLNFFTAQFPYGNGETIIENELPIIVNEFDNLKIFTHTHSHTITRVIPQEVKVIQISQFNLKTKLSLYYKIVIVYFFLIELFKAANKLFYLKKYKYWLSLLKQAALKAQHIEKNNLLLPKAINYSYWMNDWALTLTFLRKKGVINNFVFRCGGFDIWNERHEGGYLPFRGLIYKYADKIMPNTQIAEKYIKSLKLYPQKVQYKYWGTTDYGLGKFEIETELTIVSISNVIALKRVELIIDILKQVNINIKWVHFGDGNLLDDIKQKAKKISSKHKVIFKGEVPNKEIIEFFKTHTVHMLISTSSTEGLPVSMQEAISFGVPIIATNVGGVSEIVNHNTGLLLDKNFDINKPAKFINEFNNSEFNTMSKRIEIREFWNKRFNAQNIYTEFSKELKKLL